jgi:cellulose synthase/poly-beta-1,6-N-acetylglucosamine synthase-like glycosyltransferase
LSTDTTKSMQRRGVRFWEVPTTSGALMAMRREVFRACGGFDEEFFLCGEDIDLCSRVRDAGWTVVVDSESVGVHDKGNSSSGVANYQWRMETAKADVTLIAIHRGALSTILTSIAVLVGVTTREVLSFGGDQPDRLHLQSLVTFWAVIFGIASRRLFSMPALRPGAPTFVGRGGG